MDNKSAIETFKHTWPKFDSYTNKLEDLILSLLKGENIDFHLVEKRTKSVESFENKISRKNEKYSNAISEIKDISGLRVILYYNDHIEKVDKILRDNFKIDEKNTLDKKTILDDNQFGYQSYHYVVQLDENRTDLPEWKLFKDFIVEIQVRTVMQHAWASISHQLEYKKDYEIPSLLKRKLFRLAGLVELADEEFQVVRNQHLEVANAISNRLEIENTKIFDELNLNTIRQYFLAPNSTVNLIENSAKEAGFLVKNDEDDISESNILFILKLIGIKNVNSLDAILLKNIANATDYLEAIYSEHADSLGTWHGSVIFFSVLILLGYLNNEQLSEFERVAKWHKEIWGNVRTAIEKLNNGKMA